MNTHKQLINADAYVVVTPTVETTAYVYEGITKSIVNLSTSSSPYFLTEDNMFGRAGRRMGKIITTTELLGTETATLVVPRSEGGVAKLMQYAIVHQDEILTMSDLEVLNPDVLDDFFESDDVFELAFAMFSFMNWVLETTQCNVHVFSVK